MASATPLQGTELINCAQANAKEGIQMAAQQCGYSDDFNTFQRELASALDRIGIKNKDFEDLLKIVGVKPETGIEIAPGSSTSTEL